MTPEALTALLERLRLLAPDARVTVHASLLLELIEQASSVPALAEQMRDLQMLVLQNIGGVRQ